MSPERPSTRVRRKRDRQHEERAALDGVLADGLVAHVAFVRGGWPVVLPFLYGVGDLGAGPELLLHGSSGGGVFLDAGEEGLPVAVCVTHLDGLVVAASTFDSSANYRSAVVFGRARVVEEGLRWEALRHINEHLIPGRNDEVRDMSRKELAQTQVLRLPIEDWSVKIRAAGVGDSPEDGEDHAVWSGVVPLALRAGAPVASPAALGAPDPSVAAFVRRFGG